MASAAPSTSLSSRWVLGMGQETAEEKMRRFLEDSSEEPPSQPHLHPHPHPSMRDQGLPIRSAYSPSASPTRGTSFYARAAPGHMAAGHVAAPGAPQLGAPLRSRDHSFSSRGDRGEALSFSGGRVMGGMGGQGSMRPGQVGGHGGSAKQGQGGGSAGGVPANFLVPAPTFSESYPSMGAPRGGPSFISPGRALGAPPPRVAPDRDAFLRRRHPLRATVPTAMDPYTSSVPGSHGVPAAMSANAMQGAMSANATSAGAMGGATSSHAMSANAMSATARHAHGHGQGQGGPGPLARAGSQVHPSSYSPWPGASSQAQSQSRSNMPPFVSPARRPPPQVLTRSSSIEAGKGEMQVGGAVAASPYAPGVPGTQERRLRASRAHTITGQGGLVSASRQMSPGHVAPPGASMRPATSHGRAGAGRAAAGPGQEGQDPTVMSVGTPSSISAYHSSGPRDPGHTGGTSLGPPRAADMWRWGRRQAQRPATSHGVIAGRGGTRARDWFQQQSQGQGQGQWQGFGPGFGPGPGYPRRYPSPSPSMTYTASPDMRPTTPGVSPSPFSHSLHHPHLHPSLPQSSPLLPSNSFAQPLLQNANLLVKTGRTHSSRNPSPAPNAGRNPAYLSAAPPPRASEPGQGHGYGHGLVQGPGGQGQGQGQDTGGSRGPAQGVPGSGMRFPALEGPPGTSRSYQVGPTGGGAFANNNPNNSTAGQNSASGGLKAQGGGAGFAARASAASTPVARRTGGAPPGASRSDETEEGEDGGASNGLALVPAIPPGGLNIHMSPWQQQLIKMLHMQQLQQLQFHQHQQQLQQQQQHQNQLQLQQQQGGESESQQQGQEGQGEQAGGVGVYQQHPWSTPVPILLLEGPKGEGEKDTAGKGTEQEGEEQASSSRRDQQQQQEEVEGEVGRKEEIKEEVVMRRQGESQEPVERTVVEHTGEALGEPQSKDTVQGGPQSGQAMQGAQGQKAAPVQPSAEPSKLEQEQQRARQAPKQQAQAKGQPRVNQFQRRLLALETRSPGPRGGAVSAPKRQEPAAPVQKQQAPPIQQQQQAEQIQQQQQAEQTQQTQQTQQQPQPQQQQQAEPVQQPQQQQEEEAARAAPQLPEEPHSQPQSQPLAQPSSQSQVTGSSATPMRISKSISAEPYMVEGMGEEEEPSPFSEAPRSRGKEGAEGAEAGGGDSVAGAEGGGGLWQKKRLMLLSLRVAAQASAGIACVGLLRLSQSAESERLRGLALTAQTDTSVTVRDSTVCDSTVTDSTVGDGSVGDGVGYVPGMDTLGLSLSLGGSSEEGGEAELELSPVQEPLLARNVRRSKALFRALTAWLPRRNPAHRKGPPTPTPTSSSHDAGAGRQPATGAPGMGAPGAAEGMPPVCLESGAETSAEMSVEVGAAQGEWARLLGAAAKAEYPPSLATLLRSTARPGRGPPTVGLRKSLSSPEAGATTGTGAPVTAPVTDSVTVTGITGARASSRPALKASASRGSNGTVTPGTPGSSVGIKVADSDSESSDSDTSSEPAEAGEGAAGVLPGDLAGAEAGAGAQGSRARGGKGRESRRKGEGKGVEEEEGPELSGVASGAPEAEPGLQKGPLARVLRSKEMLQALMQKGKQGKGEQQAEVEGPVEGRKGEVGQGGWEEGGGKAEVEASAAPSAEEPAKEGGSAAPREFAEGAEAHTQKAGGTRGASTEQQQEQQEEAGREEAVDASGDAGPEEAEGILDTNSSKTRRARPLLQDLSALVRYAASAPGAPGGQSARPGEPVSELSVLSSLLSQLLRSSDEAGRGARAGVPRGGLAGSAMGALALRVAHFVAARVPTHAWEHIASPSLPSSSHPSKALPSSSKPGAPPSSSEAGAPSSKTQSRSSLRAKPSRGQPTALRPPSAAAGAAVSVSGAPGAPQAVARARQAFVGGEMELLEVLAWVGAQRPLGEIQGHTSGAPQPVFQGGEEGEGEGVPEAVARQYFAAWEGKLLLCTGRGGQSLGCAMLMYHLLVRGSQDPMKLDHLGHASLYAAHSTLPFVGAERFIKGDLVSAMLSGAKFWDDYSLIVLTGKCIEAAHEGLGGKGWALMWCHLHACTRDDALVVVEQPSVYRPGEGGADAEGGDDEMIRGMRESPWVVQSLPLATASGREAKGVLLLWKGSASQASSQASSRAMSHASSQDHE